MKLFYFTFGYGQRPGIGYYTTIEAENEWEAREKMNSKFGRSWAFCYHSPEAAGVDKYNLSLYKGDDL
jgi:hypothetical protein